MAKKIYEKILDFHASWIVVNSIQGCPMECQYCFLKPLGLNKTKPTELCSPQKAIDDLLKSPLYSTDFPICLLTSTDPFSNSNTINHLCGMLDKLNEKNVPNLICLVTKKYIPSDMIEKISHNKNIIVYLSYSGLDNSIEKGVNHQDILKNFKNLYNAKIPCIHYWRPILPQNAKTDVIERVMKEVAEYCKVSVIAGLKIYASMAENNLHLWDEAVMAYKKQPMAECFWPKNALMDIRELSKKHHHPTYTNNLCALAYLQKKETGMGFCNPDCHTKIYCPIEQQALCNKQCFHSKEKIISVLASLNINYKYVYNSLEHKIILKSSQPIPNYIVARIRRKTNCVVETQKDPHTKFNSSLINASSVEI